MIFAKTLRFKDGKYEKYKLSLQFLQKKSKLLLKKQKSK